MEWSGFLLDAMTTRALTCGANKDAGYWRNKSRDCQRRLSRELCLFSNDIYFPKLFQTKDF